jgi:biopolymer transport protein ExbD
MPKVKLPRSTPSIDMTPMVDLAFLLVTFFMLTTKFRPDEPVTVTIPASVSQTKVSENTTTINIDSAGRVFYDMDGKELRAMVIQDLAKNFTQIGTLTPLEIQRFSVMGAFGVPMAQLKQYVDAGETDRKTLNTQSRGIPIDSIPHDELADWVTYGWNRSLVAWETKHPAEEKYPPFNIKADGNAKYKTIKKVIDICQAAGIQHFDLVTTLRMKPQ